MERIDVAVIGGGVVGLATACALAARGFSTCVLERRPRVGLEASTHNSGVIHGGIYYPSGSLKASLCVEGRERLYRFCADADIAHVRCGKLIVASDDDEIPSLERLAAQGQANGIDDLEILDRKGSNRLEPSVRAAAALWSPSTGIVEAEAFVRALAQRAKGHDVAILPATEVIGGQECLDGVEITTNREQIVAAVVVNAAGLYADDISAGIGGERFTIYPVRGEYAELVPSARQMVSRPVYPLPAPSGHGLGVHVTPTTWGSVMLGPTATYQTDKGDYESARRPVDAFYDATRRLLPQLTPSDLRPGGTGIRARPAPAGDPFSDFIIRADREIPALIHAAGIDSPGLTASLSIGDMVTRLVEERLR